VEDARKELLDAEAAVRESGQTRAAAADLAARATAVAPFSGIVAERWHNPGDLIDASEHVLRLVDPTRLQVTAAVPVADVSRVVVGHAARVTVPGAEATEISGKVVGAPAFVDTATGTASVRIALASALPVGTPVQVAIVAEERPSALIVPAAAVVRDEDETAVFVVGLDGKAHRRPVVAGLTSGDETQIVSGLREGEKVVIKGQDALPDGAAVTVE
jgi:RND family efflux transporter MFP subunit